MVHSPGLMTVQSLGRIRSFYEGNPGLFALCHLPTLALPPSLKLRRTSGHSTPAAHPAAKSSPPSHPNVDNWLCQLARSHPVTVKSDAARPRPPAGCRKPPVPLD